MRNDAHWGGQMAYTDCRDRVLTDQGGLCAYCEIDIGGYDPLKCRIEHFHPKSDVNAAHNWALDWGNMLAVCSGGSQSALSDPTYFLKPLPENLSCDAYKDRQVQSGALTADCAGWILDPQQIFAFPCLFKVNASDGSIEPDDVACGNAPPAPDNHHASTFDLVKHTIDMLNLNCNRLMRARLVVVRAIERAKKQQRDKGFNAQQGLANLAKSYLQRPWPGFFTTIRLQIGQAAEQYLRQNNFQG
ncbi:hypothetical protein UU5_09896 [Rhodanobacter sp. 115]|nr:hypothetical protein UU5_09896 [Rhodanobacter sp. 115]